MPPALIPNQNSRILKHGFACLRNGGHHTGVANTMTQSFDFASAFMDTLKQDYIGNVFVRKAAALVGSRKSYVGNASTSRKRWTHQPSVRDFGRCVDVHSKPEKYGLMAKQKQAEECVLYVRVSTTRQAEDGVSIDAQIAKGKANAEFRNLLLPDENIFIDDGVSAKVPL